jgi:hypothetical protein
VNAVFGSEALVCFQSQSVPIHPWTLVADLPWDEVEEGAPVTVSRAKLSVGRFALPLEEAEVVDLTFHPPEHLVSLEELREHVALIKQLLAETPDPFEGEFDRAFVRDRDRILAEWQETGAPEVLLELIGRGPGTTPAGDDTLIGLLAGLEVLAAVAPDLARSRLQATRHMLRARSLPRTSFLSAELLESATGGRFPSDLLGLLAGLANPETALSDLLGLAQRVLDAGHTTGWSALVACADSLARLITLTRRASPQLGRVSRANRAESASPAHWAPAADSLLPSRGFSLLNG